MPYRPLASEAGFVHICGHRGHSVGVPENTLPALDAAAALGATVCEIDVVLSRDDEIVLLHDELLDRTTDGKGRAADRTLAELQKLDAGAWVDPRFAGTRLPTLAQALETARAHRMGLLIEIKERRRVDVMIERLGAVLAEQRATDDALVISFDHPSLTRLRERFTEIRTELITHARHIDPVRLARQAGATSFDIAWDMFHPDDARALHAAGIATRVTIPHPDKIAQRRRGGIDLLATIAPAVAEGLIDVVAGDDVRAVRELVQGKGAPLS